TKILMTPRTEGTLKPILKYAEDEEIDLIVVGTRGRTGITRVLLGSVASGVVTYAHCPVIVVK
ncbi:MAG: universal stress protein, partial [Nitrososphaeraceae archaeon]